jgi:hypothetical protein
MQLPASSREQVLIPVTGPPGTDLTTLTPQVAIIPDTGAEPLDSDYHGATWVNGQASLTIGPGSTLALAAGEYMAWVRLTGGSTQPVMQAGRIRVGDPRLI